MSGSDRAPSQARRRAALQRRLAADGLDGLLVTDLMNIRYLTGFTGSNAALLVAAEGDDGTRFCTDFRYLTQSEAAGTRSGAADRPAVRTRLCCATSPAGSGSSRTWSPSPASTSSTEPDPPS